MLKTSSVGMFITFEGGEGSGKTTQARLMLRRLRHRRIDALLTHEPGGTPQGRRLRHLLKQGGALSPVVELLLFNVDRAMHVEQVLQPALQAHRIILCDRFVDSTIAYQGYGRGLDLATVQGVCRLATSGLKPDLTVLLTLPPEEGLKRKGATKDRFETADLAFHRRVQQGYLELVDAQPRRWLVVDGAQERRAIAEVIWGAVWPLVQSQEPRKPGV